MQPCFVASIHIEIRQNMGLTMGESNLARKDSSDIPVRQNMHIFVNITPSNEANM